MFQKQNKECLLKFIKLYVFNNSEFQALQLHTIIKHKKKFVTEFFIPDQYILKSVHFKNTVARSSVHSKIWSFSLIHQLTLFWFSWCNIENDHNFEWTEDRANGFLKWIDFTSKIFQNSWTAVVFTGRPNFSKFLDVSGFYHPNFSKFLDGSRIYHPNLFASCVLTRFLSYHQWISNFCQECYYREIGMGAVVFTKVRGHAKSLDSLQKLLLPFLIRGSVSLYYRQGGWNLIFSEFAIQWNFITKFVISGQNHPFNELSPRIQKRQN